MPYQAPQWTDFLLCPVCRKVFNGIQTLPISLVCGHTICRPCMAKLHQKKCPFDQNQVAKSIDELPANFALLHLLNDNRYEGEALVENSLGENMIYYKQAEELICQLVNYLSPLANDLKMNKPNTPVNSSSIGGLSRPMLRKLVALVSCQLIEEEGRARAMRSIRSLGERTVIELILQHQNPQQLSANLWSAVRNRGCQFLGPAMQEEVLRLVLLALEDGSALSRKVLVLFVVQKLEGRYPQASKTAIGHVVQLLYRASCFKVSKREDESSLMQLKDEFRNYDSLRREHDSQIVQIATEAGLRIAPDQWSSLLYGDSAHKSHMQSIIDKLQTIESFSQSISELMIALQRTSDPAQLTRLQEYLEDLAKIESSPDVPPPSWDSLVNSLHSVKIVVDGLVDFVTNHSQQKVESPGVHNAKYKTSMCRDLTQGSCLRGANCTFAHSEEELEKYRLRSKKYTMPRQQVVNSAQLSPKEQTELVAVTRATQTRFMEPDMATVVASNASSMSQVPDGTTSNPTRISHPIANVQPHIIPCDGSDRQYLARGDYSPHAACAQFGAHQLNLSDRYNYDLSQLQHQQQQQQHVYQPQGAYYPVLQDTRTLKVCYDQSISCSSLQYNANESLQGLQQRRSVLLAKLHKNGSVRLGDTLQPNNPHHYVIQAATTSNDTAVRFIRTSPVKIQELPLDSKQAVKSSSYTAISTSVSTAWTTARQYNLATVPRGSSGLTQTTNRYRSTSAGRHTSNRGELDDCFIPFDPPIVSKFGPIARSSGKTDARMKLTEPVQSMSHQGEETTPVDAITSTSRPYPSPSPVPSMFACIPGRPNEIMYDPNTGETIPGHRIAHVVPVAQVPPNMVHSSTITSSPNHANSSQLGSIAEREQVKLELGQVNQKIEKMEEDVEIARELQLIELGIWQTEQELLQHAADQHRDRFPDLSLVNEGHDYTPELDVRYRYMDPVNVQPNPGIYSFVPEPPQVRIVFLGGSGAWKLH